MASQKLTKAFVAGLQPQDKDVIYWDNELKGFGVKVTPKGRKVFLVLHRPKNHTGNRKVFTIGPHTKMDILAAREMALKVIAASRDGTDLGEEKRDEARRKSQHLVSDLVRQFIEKHASKNRTAKATERTLNNDLVAEFGKKSVHSITKHDIISIIEGIEQAGHPSKAVRALATLSKFFNWCLSRGIIDRSPVLGVSASTKNQSRDRVLNEKEIKAIITAARTMGAPFGPFIELLFFSAQRRNEVAGMRWSEIDLEKKIWTIPSDRAKNGKAHDVHLCDTAIALLKKLPRFPARESDGNETPSDFVFTTTGTTPISGFSKAKGQLDKLSGVTNWRVHDIRRTAATEMSKLGVPIHVVEAILNHKSGTVSGIVAVYQRNQFTKERLHAINKWCNFVTKILSK